MVKIRLRRWRAPAPSATFLQLSWRSSTWRSKAAVGETAPHEAVGFERRRIAAPRGAFGASGFGVDEASVGPEVHGAIHIVDERSRPQSAVAGRREMFGERADPSALRTLAASGGRGVFGPNRRQEKTVRRGEKEFVFDRHPYVPIGFMGPFSYPLH